jgi:hypothetical protein
MRNENDVVVDEQRHLLIMVMVYTIVMVLALDLIQIHLNMLMLQIDHQNILIDYRVTLHSDDIVLVVSMTMLIQRM